MQGVFGILPFDLRGVFDLRRPTTGLQALFFNRIAVRMNKPLFYSLEILLHEKLEKAENVLDVGTGPGHFPIILAQAFPHLRIVGVDLSPDMISEAKKNVEKAGVKNAEIKEADVLELPFDSESFDVVTSNFSIKHWQDREKGLSEILRVLKKDGVAWIVEIEKNAKPSKFDELFSVVSPELKIILLPMLKYFVTKNGVSSEELNACLKNLRANAKGMFRTATHLPIVYAVLKKK